MRCTIQRWLAACGCSHAVDCHRGLTDQPQRHRRIGNRRSVIVRRAILSSAAVVGVFVLASWATRIPPPATPAQPAGTPAQCGAPAGSRQQRPVVQRSHRGSRSQRSSGGSGINVQGVGQATTGRSRCNAVALRPELLLHRVCPGQYGVYPPGRFRGPWLRQPQGAGPSGQGAGMGPQQVLLLGNHDLWLRDFAMAARFDRIRRPAGCASAATPRCSATGSSSTCSRPSAERFARAQTGCSSAFRPRTRPSWTGSSSPSASATIFSATPASARTCRSSSSCEADLLWIREPFLSWSGDSGKIIVHGHTVDEHAGGPRATASASTPAPAGPGGSPASSWRATERRFLAPTR